MEKVKDIFINNGNYEIMRDLLIEEEFDNTLEGDWAIAEERASERIFNTMCEQAKEAYSLMYAEKWADEVMEMNEKEFLEHYGDFYAEYLEDKENDND